MGDDGAIGAHHRIESVVDEMPAAIAAYLGERRLTYAEIDAIANGIAFALLERVVPGRERVVITGGHDALTAAAMVGVLKTGAAFVVLDEGDPTWRRREICARVDPIAVVSLGTTEPDLGLDVPVVSIEDAPPTSQRPNVAIDLSDTAWIVFTSGTSGRPKGVLATHQFVTRPATVDTDGPTPGVMSIVAGRLCWHGGVMTVVRSWTVGGGLVFHDLVADGAHGLADRIDRFSVDRVFLVPSVARTLIAGLDQDRRLSSLRRVTFGGEQLWWNDLARMVRHLDPECRVINSLSSSETGAISRFGIVAAEVRGDEQGPVPVGRVLDRWRYRIVDGDRKDVCAGDVGELVVTSPYLFEGYWRDPDLDAARLTVEQTGDRWFATGDLVVEDEQASLVHVGRADLQMKLAGVLVAPQEAEQLLAEAPGVTEAAVVGCTDSRGRQRLVAHVRVDEGFRGVDDLAAMLRERLPAPLIPSQIRVTRDELPRLGTGKVDRSRLAAISAVPPTGRGGEPRGEVEKVIAAVVAEVLGVDSLGRHDDFWELGGDSLGAVELVEMLEHAVGERLELTALIDCPTPAGLAARIGHPGPHSGDLVWLTPGDAVPLVVIPGAGDTALRFRGLATDLGGVQPVVVVEHAGSLRRQRPSFSVTSAAERMERLIETLSPSPIVLVGHSYGGNVAYECARRLEARGRAPAAVVLLDTRADGRRTSKAAMHVRARNEQPTMRWLVAGMAGVVRRTRRAARVPVALAFAGLDQPGTVRHHDRLLVVATWAAARYRPGPYGGRVLLVRSTQRVPEVDPTMGWCSFAPKTEVVQAPGRHDLLPMRSEIADIIRSEIADIIRSEIADRGSTQSSAPDAEAVEKPSSNVG